MPGCRPTGKPKVPEWLGKKAHSFVFVPEKNTNAPRGGATRGGAARGSPPLPSRGSSGDASPPVPPTKKKEDDKAILEEKQQQQQLIYQIRRHPIKNQPESVVLEARARNCPSTSEHFVVPLHDYLRTITRLGHSDKAVPIGTLFGVLERMRATAKEVEYISELSMMEESEREMKGQL